MRINTIAKKEVFDFKEQHCDENELIIDLIRKDLAQYFKPPILDVGSGIGDIAFRALKGKKTILLDVNPISRHDYPCRPEHFRKRGDFLEFESKEKVNTLFVSHTLQFLDDDVDELNLKVYELDPENVITVLNMNDDFMGELLEWANSNCVVSNPEVRIKNFLKGYNLIKTVDFKAHVRCQDFLTLAKQVSYLILVDAEQNEKELVDFLRSKLKNPEFSINQSIDVHRRI